MKILLLGGTGAMGTHLAELLKDEHQVYITTRKKIQNCDGKTYISGNSKDLIFLTEILKIHWDVVIDFMVYSTNEFKERIDLILNNTSHYIFLSSARVFANEVKVIVEDSPRLLDVCQDKEYLETDEYALSKARQEDILRKSKFENWTIIRPYITFSENRLQLGVLEKEEWLYRALKGRSIVFCEEMLDKRTTLTYGLDVAVCIANLLGLNAAKSNAYNVTVRDFFTWREILEVYKEIFFKETRRKLKIVILPVEDFLKTKPNNQYQVINDRLYDRIFDNSKIEALEKSVPWTDPKEALKKCLTQLIKNPEFLSINWQTEVIRDKFSGEITPLWEIKGNKNKIKYLLKRFL